jgi:hypothetical protein
MLLRAWAQAPSPLRSRRPPLWPRQRELAPSVLFETMEEEIAERARELANPHQGELFRVLLVLRGVWGRLQSCFDGCDNLRFLFGQLLLGPIEPIERALGRLREYRSGCARCGDGWIWRTATFYPLDRRSPKRGMAQSGWSRANHDEVAQEAIRRAGQPTAEFCGSALAPRQVQVQVSKDKIAPRCGDDAKSWLGKASAGGCELAKRPGRAVAFVEAMVYRPWNAKGIHQDRASVVANEPDLGTAAIRAGGRSAKVVGGPTRTRLCRGTGAAQVISSKMPFPSPATPAAGRMIVGVAHRLGIQNSKRWGRCCRAKERRKEGATSRGAVWMCSGAVCPKLG